MQYRSKEISCHSQSFVKRTPLGIDFRRLWGARFTFFCRSDGIARCVSDCIGSNCYRRNRQLLCPTPGTVAHSHSCYGGYHKDQKHCPVDKASPRIHQTHRALDIRMINISGGAIYFIAMLTAGAHTARRLPWFVSWSLRVFFGRIHPT